MPLNHNFHYKQDYTKKIFINKRNHIKKKAKTESPQGEINTQCVCCDFTPQEKN